MKRLLKRAAGCWRALAGGVLALGLMLGVAPLAHAKTAVEIHGQLAVKGNRIVDQRGRTVVLRGMSLFWSQWQPQYYNKDVVNWLVTDWNVNLVRAAVAAEPDGYIAHPEREMVKVEAVIDAAIANGIYVLVDWHAHQPRPKEAIAFFESIARKYGNTPNVIYETYNEPLREHGWAEVVKPYHMEVIPAIRAIDPDNLIIAGTPTWSQDVDIAANDPLPFSNVAYTMHFYAGTHGDELRAKTEAALKKGIAIFVTEWGASEANGDGHLATEATRVWWAFLDKHNLSYANWSIADKVEIASALMPGASASGGWGDEMITPTGKLVRENLRAKNPKPKKASWLKKK